MALVEEKPETNITITPLQNVIRENERFTDQKGPGEGKARREKSGTCARDPVKPHLLHFYSFLIYNTRLERDMYFLQFSVHCCILVTYKSNQQGRHHIKQDYKQV